nr:hypothetical protein [Morchella crassipes]
MNPPRSTFVWLYTRWWWEVTVKLNSGRNKIIGEAVLNLVSLNDGTHSANDRVGWSALRNGSVYESHNERPPPTYYSRSMSPPSIHPTLRVGRMEGGGSESERGGGVLNYLWGYP